MMSKEEIKKFWDGVEETAKDVETWPSWKMGGSKEDERFKGWPRCQNCEWPVETPIKIGKWKVCKNCQANAYKAHVEDLEAELKRVKKS